MSNVPRQQQKQIQEAEELHRRHYGGEAAPAPEDKAPAEEAPDLSLVDTATPAPVEEPIEEPSAAPEGKAKAKAPAKEKPADPYAGNYEKLLHAHKTLQGKYEAESARAKDQLDALHGRVYEMEQLLAKAPTAAETSVAEQVVQRLVSDEEIEDYGPDMIDVIRRAARETVGPELERLRVENERLQQQLGGVQQTSQLSARQTMLNYLDKEFSVWRQINSDPAFVRWAEDIDTFSGQRRIDMLRAAFDNNNGTRVLAFFKAFAKENAAFTQTSTQTETPSKAQVDLNTLVAPGRAVESSAPRAQDESTASQWTEAQIAEFYRDVQSGVYRNDPAKKARIENDIFAAQKAGRIVG